MGSFTRTAWHIFPGFLELFLLVCGYSVQNAIVVITPLLGSCVLLDCLRDRLPFVTRWFEANGLKDCERTGMTGTTFYVIAVYTNLITATLWPSTQRLWFLGLWFLALGDPAAGFVGRRWGRHKVAGTGGKTIEGFCACFACCFVLALAFLLNPQVGPQLPLETTGTRHIVAIALCGATVAALTELMCPGGGVWDNLLIAFAGSLSMAVRFNGWETLGSFL